VEKVAIRLKNPAAKRFVGQAITVAGVADPG
jgi:hypothetical protein